MIRTEVQDEPSAHGMQTAPKRLWTRIFEPLRNTLALVGLMMIVYHACFEVSVVTTNSMAPTLRGEGEARPDVLLSERMSLRFRAPRRWEVVQYYNEEGTLVAKRVVGLPGETLELREHQLLINGRPAEIPGALSFLKYYPYGELRSGRAITVEGGYYLLGDQSMDSQDSRYVGAVPLTRMRSRAWLRIGPWARFGRVSP